MNGEAKRRIEPLGCAGGQVTGGAERCLSSPRCLRRSPPSPGPRPAPHRPISRASASSTSKGTVTAPSSVRGCAGRPGPLPSALAAVPPPDCDQPTRRGRALVLGSRQRVRRSAISGRGWSSARFHLNRTQTRLPSTASRDPLRDRDPPVAASARARSSSSLVDRATAEGRQPSRDPRLLPVPMSSQRRRAAPLPADRRRAQGRRPAPREPAPRRSQRRRSAPCRSRAEAESASAPSLTHMNLDRRPGPHRHPPRAPDSPRGFTPARRRRQGARGGARLGRGSRSTS